MIPYKNFRRLSYFVFAVFIVGVTTENVAFSSDMTCSNNATEPMFLCDKEQFSRTCLPYHNVCNGIPECPGGQDEAVTECGCLANEFRCSNTCVALVKRCDRHADCDSGEDEQDCKSRQVVRGDGVSHRFPTVSTSGGTVLTQLKTFLCPMTHFKCNNHFCVPLHAVCDFKDDCGDNSEEIDCPHRPCWNGEFQCSNGECLRPGYLCDIKENCIDGSDEWDCGRDAFVECGDGSKVHRSYWCDDWPECTDNHADEINCHVCSKSYEFQCPNGRCIRQANRCDSQCDCIPLPNSTSNYCADEVNCSEYYTIKNGLIFCTLGKSLSCSVPSSDFSNAKVRCIRPEFLCDGYTDCHNGHFLSDEFGCDEDLINRISDTSQIFRCRDGRIVPANLRCDFKADCLHGDDEFDCPVIECEPGEWTCLNGQCIDMKEVCDLQINCLDKSDEINCHDVDCSPGQKKCTGSGQCVPQEFWCDHFYDCPDASDEMNCRTRNCRFDEFRCTNGQCIDAKYRCYNSGQPRSGCADGSHLLQCNNWECESHQFKCHKGPCLHESLLCDGSIHCAGSWEDENNCSFSCSHMSPQCECKDVHLNCTMRNITAVPVDTEKEITWFCLGGNLLNTSLNNETFLELERLLYLDLSNNSITFLPPLMFRTLWRLSVLDLQNNALTHLVNSTFYGLANLNGLHLQGNNLRTLEAFAFYGLSFLKTLDLHGQKIKDIEQDAFIGLRSLTLLDLSQNQLTYLAQGALRGLPNLLFLDLSGNQFRIIEGNVFRNTRALEKLVTDEFRFCCLARQTTVCLPPPDQFSSCEDLMSNIVLRLCVWLLAGVATIGNVLVIIWRTRYSHCNQVHSFLITNLALGDLLMGTYLLLIALVDCYYRGDYIIHDSEWRSSGLCALAGFLSTFSSELSVFTLTVITLDRFLVIIFPFRVRRMEMTRTKRLMALGWMTAAVLSALPLAPVPYFYNFYGRSGVCLALHITPDKPNGWEYSVFVFLFLNLISFGVIAVGYLWMFIAARTTQHAVTRQRRNTESAMAWRMSLLVATDAACWVPIIILGFASLTGFTVPPQVFAWVAVFVLPLNAAINPVLYTLSTAPFLTPAQNGIHTFRHSCRLSRYTYSSTALNRQNDSPRSETSYPIKRTSFRWHQRIDSSVTEHGEVLPLRQLGD